MSRYPTLLLLPLFTAACFTSSSATVKREDSHYLGEVLELRISLSDVNEALIDTRPDIWYGTEAWLFRLSHLSENDYEARMLPMKGDELNLSAEDAEMFEENPFPARLRVIERGNDYSVVLADLDTTFDGPSFTAIPILIAGDTAFIGYLPCVSVPEIQFKGLFGEVRCTESQDNLGLNPFAMVEFFDRGDSAPEKLALYERLVRERRIFFAVDCEETPGLSDGAFGFETICYKWTQPN